MINNTNYIKNNNSGNIVKKYIGVIIVIFTILVLVRCVRGSGIVDNKSPLVNEQKIIIRRSEAIHIYTNQEGYTITGKDVYRLIRKGKKITITVHN